MVIPVLNGERYIAEALSSVCAQTRPPAEVIVVDNGSTDASVEIAGAFGSPVEVLTWIAGGAPGARNAGLRRAAGDVVAFLDADDTWAADKLSAQLSTLGDASAPDLVFGHVDEFVSPELTDCAALPAPRGVVPGRVITTMLAKRATFDRVGWFDESLPAADFLDWLARARALGLTERMLDAVVARRRIHERNSQWTSRKSDITRALHAAIHRRAATDPRR